MDRMLAVLARPAAGDVARVARAIRAEFARNFTRQGSQRGPWAALAPRTVRERRRLGYGPTRPILIRSGRYYRAAAVEGAPGHVVEFRSTGRGWALAVGSDDARARWLEFGTRRMPARPVAALDTGQERRIGAEIEAMVQDIVRRVR